MDEAPCPKKRINCFFSRKKYNQILESMSAMGIDEEAVRATASIIRRVLDFDPDDRTRSAYQLEYVRRKAVENGVSTYIASGRKAQYMRSKQEKGT